MSDLSHLDSEGVPRMVDVGGKDGTQRRAVARGVLVVGEEIIRAVRDRRTPKGNVIETARLAGVMAAKRTADLIPLCHNLPLTHVAVDFDVEDDRIVTTASAATKAGTGVEMEALTACSVALLTLYDMLKALSKAMEIGSVRLIHKSGGKSGDYDAA